MTQQEEAARLKALELAHGEVGVKEVPLGSNWGPKVKEYLAAAGINSPAPWCAAFVTWCFKGAGVTVETPGPALVENWVTWGERHGALVARPFKGDCVCYDWNGDRWYDHIGFVDKVLAVRWRGRMFAGWIRTVEGNTSDAVLIKYRWANACAFVRIKGLVPKK